MQIKKAVITAAGFGSRFLPITKTFSKEMLPILDKPIIHHQVLECQAAGAEEIIIIVAPAEVAQNEDYFYDRADRIEKLLKGQSKLDRWAKVEEVFELPKITIVPQDEKLPYGNGTPLLTVKKLVENEEAFMMMFGDDLVLSEKPALGQLVKEFQAHPCDVMLGAEKVELEEVSAYGILNLIPDSGGRVKSIWEKPTPEEAPSQMALYGRFILTPKIFETLTPDGAGKDGELWMTDAINQLGEKGAVIQYVDIDGKWFTTGDPLNLLLAQVAYALRDNKEGGFKKKLQKIVS